MIDVRQYPEILRTINAIVSAKGVAEVKIEEWKDGNRILVVEQNRSVKLVERVKNK